jgi:hypothetical protein
MLMADQTIINTCSTRFKLFHPHINLWFTHSALLILRQHSTVNFRMIHSFRPIETALRHVRRWRNLAQERPRFRPRCCHSTGGRALYCKWQNSSTGIVNSAQCARSCPGYRVILKLPLLFEVFTCFFLSCKANARVKHAKTGHRSHSS